MKLGLKKNNDPDVIGIDLVFNMKTATAFIHEIADYIAGLTGDTVHTIYLKLRRDPSVNDGYALVATIFDDSGSRLAVWTSPEIVAPPMSFETLRQGLQILVELARELRMGEAIVWVNSGVGD